MGHRSLQQASSGGTEQLQAPKGDPAKPPTRHSQKQAATEAQQIPTASSDSPPMNSVIAALSNETDTSNVGGMPNQESLGKTEPHHLAQSPSAIPQKPRHTRGRSQNLTLSHDVPGEDNHAQLVLELLDNALLNPSSPSLLSKSAPATSFLMTHPQKKLHYKSSEDQIQLQKHSKNPIRGSNSADEWDMPLTSRRNNDALTWQQQDLSRIRISAKANKIADKFIVSGEHTGSKKPAHLSAISAMAIPDTPLQPLATPPSYSASPAPLTWQQALLQPTGPGTPSSSVFTALEDGHSGTHPAKESRSRPSPHKQRKQWSAPDIHKVATRSAPASEEEGLDIRLSGLTLDGKLPSHQNAKKTSRRNPPVFIASSPIKIPSAGKQPNTRSSSHLKQPAQPTSDSEADVSLDEAANLSFEDEIPSHLPSFTPTKPRSIPASPVKNTLYAGPKFHNSPSAGALPTPRMAAFLAKNREVAPTVGEPLVV